MLQFSTHTKKIRINLGCNFPHKTKFGSTCVGIFHTKQNCNLCCNSPHKTKFGSTCVGIFHTKQNSDQPMLDFSTQNKIRINLCWTFPHKTKFGSTYVSIFHTKQNSRDVPSHVRTCFSRNSQVHF